MSEQAVFEQLAVAGFGPYRVRVKVRFPNGFGVMVGPNEQGKSTLIAAMTAILFGLPVTSDPSSFGTERYRNKWGPTECFGELVLRVGAVRWRVWRNFDNHRIIVAREQPSGWEQEVVGEHNPNARRPNRRYEAWLARLVGHTSRDVFEATFYLPQAYTPAEALEEDVQALLSGGYSRGYEGALEWLVEAAKAITARTGALGMTPRDGRRPGRLDTVREEIERLREAIESSAEQVDALRRIASELDEQAAQLARQRDELARPSSPCRRASALARVQAGDRRTAK